MKELFRLIRDKKLVICINVKVYINGKNIKLIKKQIKIELLNKV